MASVCTITGEVAFSCVACLVVRRARLKVREDSDVCTACLIAWKTLMTEITSTLSTAVDHPNVVVQLRHSPLAETRCEFDNRLFVYTLYLLLKYQWEHTPGRVYHTVCCRVLLMGLYAKYAPHDPHNASAEKPGELRLAAR